MAALGGAKMVSSASVEFNSLVLFAILTRFRNEVRL